MANYAIEFTDDEIREQLNALGYSNISEEQLKLFKNDLEELIICESRNSQISSVASSFKPAFQNESKPVASQIIVPEQKQTNLPNYQTNVNAEAWDSIQAQRQKPARTVFGNLVQSNIPVDLGSARSSTGSLHSGLSAGSSAKPRQRFVCRHRNGRSIVCDESITGSDCSSDISWMQNQMSKLRVKMDDEGDGKIRPNTLSRLSRSWSMTDLADLPKSFIRTAPPNSSNKRNRKHDPVARYHEYRKWWASHKMPGEAGHTSLRWNIRALLLDNAEPVQVKPMRATRSSLA